MAKKHDKKKIGTRILALVLVILMILSVVATAIVYIISMIKGA